MHKNLTIGQILISLSRYAKQFIVATLIGFLVFACLGGIRGYNASKVTPEKAKSIAEADDIYYKQLESLTQQLKIAEDKLTQHEKSLQQDFYYQFEASQLYQTDRILDFGYLESDIEIAGNRRNKVRDSYEVAFKSSAFWGDLAAALGLKLDNPYISLSPLVIVAVQTNVDQLLISTWYDDPIKSKQLNEIAYQLLSKQVTKMWGEHTSINLLSEPVSWYGFAVQDYQADKLNTTIALKNAVSEQQKALDEHMLNAPSQDVLRIEGEFSKRTVVKSGVKYGLVGIFLAAGIYAAFLLLRLYNTDRALDVNEIVSTYQIKYLGRLIDSDQKDGIACRMVKAFLGEVDKKISKQESYAIVLENVKHIMNEGSPKAKVLLVSASISSEILQEIRSWLEPELNGQTILVAGAVMSSTEAVNAIMATDSVLLVESVNNLFFHKLNIELMLIDQYQKPIDGMILI